MMLISVFLMILLNSVTEFYAAKILCYFPFPSKSHQSYFQPIWKELSLRGHQITLITTEPIKDQQLINLTVIDVSSTYDFVETLRLQDIMSTDKTKIEQLDNIHVLWFAVLEYQLRQDKVLNVLKAENNSYDLILIENFFLPLYALSYKFGAPLIGVISFPMPQQTHYSSGNPIHPVLYPDINFIYKNGLGFLERWDSTFYDVWQHITYFTKFLPVSQDIARRYFGDDVPDLHELAKNVSLQLDYSNPVIHPPRPNVPKVIQLNRMHMNFKEQTLPVDLKKILDEATEGLIYFSLGSNVKSTSIPDNLKRVIMDALSELPYKVLWKWEASDMPGKSENVYLRKWLPQQALLAHPNLKVFVTQGGLQSIEESLINGVPMVGMPFYGDQHMNVIKLAEAGIAVYVDKDTVTRDELKNAILKVAADKRYKEKAVEAGNILSDHPMKPLDLAIWWIEYVIRHKGAPHLRSPAVDLPWYQYYLLDVLGASLMAVILAGYVLYKMITVMSRLIFASKKIKKS